MSKAKAEMLIGDIMNQYPETLEIFSFAGFDADSEEVLMRQLGPDLMLGTALKVKGVNVDLFMKMLQDKIDDIDKNASFINNCSEEDASGKKLNFLVSTVCPLKNMFKDNLNEVLKRYRKETGVTIENYIPAGCHTDNGYTDIWKVENIDDFPDVVVERGFGNYFSSEFCEKFLYKGYFQSIRRESVNKNFSGAGITDPYGCYTVYAAIPFLMIIDKNKLGDIPVPKKWSDLLKPIYRNNIIIGGKGRSVSDILLLYIFNLRENNMEELKAHVKSFFMKKWSGEE